jgi:hypothetical protein
MIRFSMCLSVMIALVSARQADSLTLSLSAPAQYVPGRPFAVAVNLADATNLGAYNIDLTLASAMGAADSDYSFDLHGTVPAPDNYVFPSAENFFAAVNTDAPRTQRLTLTDFDLNGVTTVAGFNDRVAHVVVNTAATFNGVLRLSFDPAGLFLDTPEGSAIDGYDDLLMSIGSAAPLEIEPVPEPGVLALLVVTLPLFLRYIGHPRSCDRGSCHVA